MVWQVPVLVMFVLKYFLLKDIDLFFYIVLEMPVHPGLSIQQISEEKKKLYILLLKLHNAPSKFETGSVSQEMKDFITLRRPC